MLGFGTGIDELGDTIAELLVNLDAGGGPTLVFDRVMEEGGDGAVFVATVFKDEGGDAEEVADVGDGAAFAKLVGVEVGGVGEGLGEAIGEVWVHGGDE